MTDNANHTVSDEADNRKYWTQIPNIVYALGLTPYDLTLYSILRRTAGEQGTSWKSTATLAKECNMSAGMVSQSKKRLASRFSQLGGKPLIQIEEVENPRGGWPLHHVTLTDIWPENMAYFASSQDELASSQDERDQVHHVNLDHKASSPHETKNNPSIEEYPALEEKPAAGANAPAATRKRRKRKRKPKSEAVKLFHSIFNLWPTTKQQEIIDSQVKDVARWGDALEAWAGQGHKPLNITGQLDWYFNGIPAYARKGGAGKQNRPGDRRPEDYTAGEYGEFVVA